MPFTDGMGTALPTSLDDLPKAFATFTDAEAAERLINRVSRRIAEVLAVGDHDYAADLLPIYKWLDSVIREDLAEQPVENSQP